MGHASEGTVEVLVAGAHNQLAFNACEDVSAKACKSAIQLFNHHQSTPSQASP